MANHVKPRSTAQTAISVSLTRELLARIDVRAGALGLTRSRYIAVVAQQDIDKGGPLTIAAEDESEPTAQIDLTPAALDFLKLAVPALTQYQDTHGQCPTPNVPEAIPETDLWKYFLTQREQILKDKWIQSRNAGFDIGMERAIRDWLQKNQDLWAISQADDTQAAQPNPTPSS